MFIAHVPSAKLAYMLCRLATYITKSVNVAHLNHHAVSAGVAAHGSRNMQGQLSM